MIYKIAFASAISVFNLSCSIKSYQPEPSVEVAGKKRYEAIILSKKYFTISYNPEYKMANWVKYTLDEKNLRNKSAKRNNKFYSDPELLKMGHSSMAPNDLVGSDFDRGHLAPSADFAWSQEANNATFVMSNITPQHKDLNRQAWRYLEDRIRNWACTEEQVRIITGPIFEVPLKQHYSGVKIPSRFFKIVLDITPPRKSIAFIYYQSDKDDVYKLRVVTKKAVQELVDFQYNDEALFLGETYPDSDLSEWIETKCSQAREK